LVTSTPKANRLLTLGWTKAAYRGQFA